jgi:hypothetical protein
VLIELSSRLAAISSAVADTVGGVVVIVSLIVLIRSVIEMAGDSGVPEEEDPSHQPLT